MFNFIGKGLVLVHSLLSLAALVLALLVYFEFVDWGRAEPRSVHGEPTKTGSSDVRIPSEYDKSVAIFNEAVAGRNLVVPPIAPAEASLREVEERYGPNHLYYVAQLKMLREGQGPIDVKAIAPDGVPTDTPGKPYGKPEPTIKVDGIDKSLTTYAAELKNQLDKLEAPDPSIAPEKQKNTVVKAIRDLAENDQKITQTLTGRDKDDKKTKGVFGLRELIDQEFQTQQRLKDERDYLQPQWATTVEEARRFAQRRAGLEATLAGLEKALKDRQVKQK